MMMRRLFLATAFASLPARGDTSQEVVDLLGRLAAALSEGVPEAFLRAIDPSLPDYGRFAANLTALVSQNDVSSSIEIVKQDGDDNVQVVELAWTMEIRGKGQNRSYEKRESLVRCRLERRKKQWRVLSLEPAVFFAPPASR